MGQQSGPIWLTDSPTSLRGFMNRLRKLDNITSASALRRLLVFSAAPRKFSRVMRYPLKALRIDHPLCRTVSCDLGEELVFEGCVTVTKLDELIEFTLLCATVGLEFVVRA